MNNPKSKVLPEHSQANQNLLGSSPSGTGFKGIPKTSVPKVREFKINDQTYNSTKRFPSNYIKTTKYTKWTFLPVSLLYQFKRVANMYFLMIAVLQSISIISPLNPTTAIAPLVFVLSISLIREAAEDYKRYKSDKTTNNRLIKVWECCEWKTIKSEDVKVGQIVKIHEGEEFPADVILLSSSSAGVCFIETSSLDGEKNLKKRSRIDELGRLFKNVEKNPEGDIYFYAHVATEPPNNQLYSLKASIKTHGEVYGINEKQLLLKGSSLKNTDWIIGFVIYSGTETRLMQNSQASIFKQSKLERMMNRLVVYILIAQLTLCTFIAILGTVWYSEDYQVTGYLHLTTAVGANFIIKLCSYFLLLNTLIPISLIVTLEVVKVVQGWWIQNDELMYSNRYSRLPDVSTTSINEELGQVSYIFSDKTGTLTMNIMEFKLCMIGSHLFGDPRDLDSNSGVIRRKTTNTNTRMGIEYTFESRELQDCVDEKSKTLADYTVRSANGHESMHFSTLNSLVHEFLKLLAITNDCLPEKKMDNGREKLFYNGQSPDEIALVEFAQNSRFVFYESTENSAKVKFPKGEDRLFKVYKRVEFNSDRKRMSIIIEDPIDGKVKLFCKGADSIILSRLDKNQKNPNTMKEIDNFLLKASNKGYRTLCMAMRIIEKEEYAVMKKRVSEAEANIEKRDEELAKIWDEYERNLVILGCTAVEDKLQERVPETIAELQNGGIKIWMLTGDKLETAENIAKSCRLIPLRLKEEFLIKCNTDQVKEVRNIFNKSLVEKNNKRLLEGEPMALLVEATSLRVIMHNDNRDIRDMFLKIAKTCEAVVCCRVSPSEKADVVRLIKYSEPDAITLSIGDGANDVSMILEAHIGIGLYGNEGMRAVQASDYALGEFQCLWRLILVHGRLNYLRIAELVLYFFYKNIVFTLPQLYFAFVSAYSAQTVFDDWYITLYNLLFTSVPLAIKAMVEQDVNPELDGRSFYKSFPKLHYVGRYSRIFNWTNYFIWVITGVGHSLLIFLIPYYTFKNSIITEHGLTSDLWLCSIASFTSVIFIVTMKLFVFTRYYTVFNFVAFLVISIPSYIIYMWFSNFFSYSNTYLTMTLSSVTPKFYLAIFFNVGLAYVVDTGINSFRFLLMERPVDFLRKRVNETKNKSKEEKEWAFDDIADDFYQRVEGVEKDLRESDAANRKRRERKLKTGIEEAQRRNTRDERNPENIIVENITPSGTTFKDNKQFTNKYEQDISNPGTPVNNTSQDQIMVATKGTIAKRSNNNANVDFGQRIEMREMEKRF